MSLVASHRVRPGTEMYPRAECEALEARAVHPLVQCRVMATSTAHLHRQMIKSSARVFLAVRRLGFASIHPYIFGVHTGCGDRP